MEGDAVGAGAAEGEDVTGDAEGETEGGAVTGDAEGEGVTGEDVGETEGEAEGGAVTGDAEGEGVTGGGGPGEGLMGAGVIELGVIGPEVALEFLEALVDFPAATGAAEAGAGVVLALFVDLPAAAWTEAVGSAARQKMIVMGESFMV